MAYDDAKERQEAIEAGRRALEALNAALESVSHSRSWGVYDLLAGGWFSYMLKHKHMGEIHQSLLKARESVEQFAAELKKLPDPGKSAQDIDELVSIADEFFEGPIADYMMEGRMREAKSQLEEAVGCVNEILEQLSADPQEQSAEPEGREQLPEETQGAEG